MLPATWWMEPGRLPALITDSEMLKTTTTTKTQLKTMKTVHSLKREENREGVYPEIQNQRRKQERMLRTLGCKTRCRSRLKLFHVHVRPRSYGRDRERSQS